MEQDFGQDTVIINNSEFILISIHTSNNKDKFIGQWLEIKLFIDNNPSKFFIICGDFNSKPIIKTSRSLFFVDKEDYEEVILDLNFNRNINVTKYESTTGKVRCLTSQFNKMLLPAFSAIDGFITVNPIGNKDNFLENTFSGYIEIKDEEASFISSTNEIVYPPLSWPSDHAMVYLKTIFGGICSMNAFGESISNTLPLNIFEIFTKDCWDIYQSDESIRNEFSRIKKEFFNRKYLIVGETEPTTIGNLIKKKHFSTLSRKYAIAGSVFKPPRFFQTREVKGEQTPFYNNLMSNYEIEYKKFTEDLQSQFDRCTNENERNKVREILQVVTTITNFYKECMESKILEDFFNKWYLDLETSPKLEITGVLNIIFEQLKPRFFCLQEVSEGMLQSFIEDKRIFEVQGYTFDSPEVFKLPGQQNKTRGIIFYKF
jgi:hypothetical protein